MVVQDVMSQKVVSVTPDTSYEGAAELMFAEKMNALPVVDVNGVLRGVLSEKDLFRAIYPDYGEYFINPEAFNDEDEREEKVKELRARPISVLMTTRVETVRPDTPLMLAGGLMVAHRIHSLPVVDGEKLVGVISREQVFHTILRQKLSM
jgi:CBS domain-containing protein